MQGTIIVGGFEDHPSFKMFGIRVPEAPEDEFEATVTLKITRQETPLRGEPSVEFTVLDLKSDAIEIEDVEPDKGDSGDSLAADLEELAARKREAFSEEE